MNPPLTSFEALEPRRLLAANLSGTVWDDFNGNGRREPGEPGLANQRIFIDLNFDGNFQNNEPSVFTNSSGSFTFTNRPNGIQRIRYQVLSGRRLSAPARIFYDVPVVGTNVRNLNFASTTTGVIVGSVYEDFNGNGRRDLGEPGLPGWTVFLDKDNDGRVDSNEKVRVTDVNGNFRFTGLPPGRYTLKIVQQSGFVRTQPLNGLYVQTLSAGQSFSNRNFGEREIA